MSSIETKLATTAVRLYSHEGTYPFQADAYRVEQLVEAFRRLGCEVEVDHTRSRLYVTVPQSPN
jgi:hypothetical protein